MKIGRKAYKYYEYVHTKIKVMYSQKVFKLDGISVKYMYKPCKDSEVLAIVFSACTREGVKARYNYVRTLDGMNCNRLYILDDFGPDGRGSYYLGRMPEFKEEKAILGLIKKLVQDTKPKKMLFCGSCKGAYAALNFGIEFENSSIIVGEPTYKIATEFAKAKELMKYWMGEVTKENIAYIDNHLTERLANNKNIDNQRIHLFYSEKDEYINRHSLPLVNDLNNDGYVVEYESGNFDKHADLALYFPDFLKKKVGLYL